jgi:hypothetical protein
VKDAAVFAVRHDVKNTHNIGSGVRDAVVGTLAIVSGGHLNALKSPEEMRGQNHTVSTIRTLPVTEQPLKITQPYARSAISNRNGTGI